MKKKYLLQTHPYLRYTLILGYSYIIFLTINLLGINSTSIFKIFFPKN